MKTFTHVIVKCDLHGCFEIDPHALNLMVCRTDIRLSYYEFPCECGTVRRPAPMTTLVILWGAGIRGTDWTVPAEALEPHTGPALCLDDLIDLGRDLAKLNQVSA